MKIVYYSCHFRPITIIMYVYSIFIALFSILGVKKTYSDRSILKLAKDSVNNILSY